MATKLESFQLPGAPTCRVIYPSTLMRKRAVKGTEGKEKYSCTILIPKDDKQKVDVLLHHYNLAFEDLKAKGCTMKKPEALNPKNNYLLDGDKLADESDGKEIFRGYYLLKISSEKFRPLVTDRQKLRIVNDEPVPGLPIEQMSSETLNDGDYVIVNVGFWTYKNPSAEGISCNLNAMVKMADGEQITGVSQNVDDYIDLSAYE